MENYVTYFMLQVHSEWVQVQNWIFRDNYGVQFGIWMKKAFFDKKIFFYILWPHLEPKIKHLVNYKLLKMPEIWKYVTCS